MSRLFNNLHVIYFISERFFQKTCAIALSRDCEKWQKIVTLMAELWELSGLNFMIKSTYNKLELCNIFTTSAITLSLSSGILNQKLNACKEERLSFIKTIPVAN